VNRTFTITAGITGTGADGQITYWNGTSSVTGSNNLFWDAANSRLGIGTNTPDYALKVVKSLAGGYEGIVAKNSSATGTALLSVQGSAASGNDITIFCGSPSQTFRTTFGLTGNYGELTANTANGFVMGTFSATPFILGTNDTQRLRIFGSTGNVLIQNGGTFTDGGQRLQVMGDAFIKGSGATSATNALLVQNSAGSNILRVRNDGPVFIEAVSNTAALYFSSNGDSRFEKSLTGTNGLVLYGPNASHTLTLTSFNSNNYTNGTLSSLRFAGNFVDSSGSTAFSYMLLNGTINQTGTATSITRGLYVNPTLTAAADWRSIEWSNNSGWGLYGAGTANNYLAGKLVIGTTSVGTYSLDIVGGFRATSNTIDDFVVTGANASYTTITIQNTATNGRRWLVGAAGTNGTVGNSNFFINDGTSGLTRLIINSNGYLGLNKASAGYPLDMSTATAALGALSSGGSVLVSAHFGNGFYIGKQSTTDAIVFAMFSQQQPYIWAGWDGVNITERMRLTAAGRLLLGTTSESTFLLDVNGTARVSNDFTVFKSTQPILNIQDQTGVNNGYSNFTATLWSSSPLTTLFNVWGKTAMSISSWNFNNTGYTTTTLNAFPGLTSANGGHTLVIPLNTNIQKGITFVRPDNILTTNNADAITISSATFGTYKFFRVDDIGNTYARGGAVYGSETANASAILQADSTTKGFLPPRMTTTQKNAIGTPAAGLQVYDNTDNYLSLYNGTNWQNIVSPNSNSNVLIGTASDTGYRLNVNGGIYGKGITADSDGGVGNAIYAYNQVLSGSSNNALVQLSTTWNTTGNAVGIEFNVFNTASGASSRLIDLKVDLVSKFIVYKDGKINASSLPTSATGLGTGDIWNNGGVLNIV
jgi:hypothetical protein